VTVLIEGDLQITLPADAQGRRFDDETHGLSHCMKAVDFIVELSEQVLFIEFKDPENPKAQTKAKDEFFNKFTSGNIDCDLKTKYRDSWLYEWAHDRVKKPVHYLVLIAASSLSKADLLRRTEALKKQIPVSGPQQKAWRQPFIEACVVMNLVAWNETFPSVPAKRISILC
jgi:hypothetical protein